MFGRVLCCRSTFEFLALSTESWQKLKLLSCICRYIFILLGFQVLLTSRLICASEVGYAQYLSFTYFDIPEQPLNSALLEFALQAEVEILSPYILVANQKSFPLIGSFQFREALQRLLSKTPLTFKRLDNNSWMIFLEEKSIDHEEPLKVEKDKTLLIEEVKVTASRYPFRYTTMTESSQRTNGMSVFDSARFLNVVPSQFIMDQQPSDLTDMLKHISGVTPGDGLADSNDDFYIRGFSRGSIYLDGFRVDSNTGIKISPVNIEKVETLKGPSTLFYGQAEPGGTVNIIRKSPETEPRRTVRGVWGSYDQISVDIDLTGPLLNTQNIFYRTIYARELLNVQRDLIDVDREWFSTSIRKYFSDKTRVDVQLEHNQSSSIRNQGLIVLIPDNEAIKIIAVDGENPTRQAQREFEAKQNSFDITVTHILDSGWNMQARYANLTESRRGIRTQNNLLTLTGLLGNGDDLAPDTELRQLTGVLLDGATRTIPVPVSVGTELVSGGDTKSIAQLFSVYDEEGGSETDFIRIDTGGTLSFLGMAHHIDFGAEFYKENLYENFVLEKRTDIKSLLLDTVAGEVGTVVADDVLGELINRQQTFTFNDYGIYFQDSIDITDNLVFSSGLRYTLTEGARKDVVQDITNDFETYKEASSQLGFVYKPKDYISFYSNYSESMKANYQIDDIGTNIPKPELSNQIEFGSKLFLSDGLIVGASVFDIDKENIVQVNFVEGFRRSVLGGKQNVKGLNLDFSYKFSNNTDVVGSVSWLDGKIVSGQNKGRVPSLSARHTASLFVNHRLTHYRLNGWVLSLGGQSVGNRFGNDENTILINGYGIIDAGLSYSVESLNSKYTYRLDVKNLSDETYFTAVEEGIRFNRGAGRIVVSSISVEF